MKAIPMSLRVREDAPVLDISSLIDVSFLLLVFFLVTSTLQRIETDLSLVGNGISQGSVVDPPLEVRIAISASGGVSVDGETVGTDLADHEIRALRQRLAETRELARLTDAEVLVRIDATDDAHHQRLVDVMNALASNHLSHIAFEN
jgi:biopolymer transport protein ExbD